MIGSRWNKFVFCGVSRTQQQQHKATTRARCGGEALGSGFRDRFGVGIPAQGKDRAAD